MSLSKQDLKAVRGVVVDAIESIVIPLIVPMTESISKLDGSNGNLQQGLSKLKQQFAKILSAQNGFNATQDKLVTRVATLEVMASETNRRLGSIENRLDNIDGRLETAENGVLLSSWYKN